MTTTTSTDVTTLPLTGMGQISFVQSPALAPAVLGSCIGLVLHHRRCGVGILGHIVLPKSEGRTGPPGKFADTAIPHMLELLRNEGAQTAGLTAKMVGGGNMFGNSGPLQIGVANIEAVTELLKKYGVPLRSQSVGGLKGRRLTYNSETGSVQVEIVGEEPFTI